MKNNSISDFVAASMDAALKSQEYKTLFGTQYKYAEDTNDAADKCAKCHKDKDSCMCDSAMADDQDAKKKKDDKDSSSASDSNDAKKKEDKDSSSADDQDAKKKKDDESSADDEDKISSAFDVAIDSLLTASAALDSVGLGRGSAISLKLASLTVEAKKDSKKMKDSKKSSKDSKKSDSKKDSHSAKDKKVDSKKSDSKKSDSKDSKDSKKSSKK